MAIDTGFRGIDIRQEGNVILFDAFLQDSTGALVTGGTTTLAIDKMLSDGNIESYDFADDTFKATALTTETVALAHQKGNNNTTDKGLWTYALATLTGFTVDAIYYATVTNTGASPPKQMRKFQYGGGVKVSAGGIANTAFVVDTDPSTVPARHELVSGLQWLIAREALHSGVDRSLTEVIVKRTDNATAWTVQAYGVAGGVETLSAAVPGP